MDQMDQNKMEQESGGSNLAAWIIPGVAIGTAIGLAYAAASRRKRSRWDQARSISERVYANREDLVEGGRNLMERLQIIIQEGRKVVEEAADLWGQGRKLVTR